VSLTFLSAGSIWLILGSLELVLRRRVSKGRITLTPELRDMRDQTMLFVFGL
jgi:hypothetical protein